MGITNITSKTSKKLKIWNFYYRGLAIYGHPFYGHLAVYGQFGYSLLHLLNSSRDLRTYFFQNSRDLRTQNWWKMSKISKTFEFFKEKLNFPCSKFILLSRKCITSICMHEKYKNQNLGKLKFENSHFSGCYVVKFSRFTDILAIYGQISLLPKVSVNRETPV